jgi:hypothetical protein
LIPLSPPSLEHKGIKEEDKRIERESESERERERVREVLVKDGGDVKKKGQKKERGRE